MASRWRAQVAAGAWLLTGVLATMLNDVKPNDAAVFVSTAVAVLVVAGLASSLPARSAGRVDPMIVLRDSLVRLKPDSTYPHTTTPRTPPDDSTYPHMTTPRTPTRRLHVPPHDDSTYQHATLQYVGSAFRRTYADIGDLTTCGIVAA